MGTMLYARGIFLNRSFDELNLTQPDLVAEVHQAYVRAGADVIETNTFGANRVKLGGVRPGGSRARDQRRRGRASRGTRRATRSTSPARSARSASASSPGARPGVDEAEEYFREQAPRADRRRRRSVRARDLPRRERDRRGDPRRPQRLRPADRRADDDRGGRQQPRRRGAGDVRARRSERRGADVVGLNCSVGPAAMLETLERMARVAHVKLVGAAQRRQAARGRRAQPLSLLAGLHGVVRAALHQHRRAPGRRLLRHDAGSHPRHQGRGAIARAGRGDARTARAPQRAGRRAPARRRCRASRSRGWPTRWRAAASSSASSWRRRAASRPTAWSSRRGS